MGYPERLHVSHSKSRAHLRCIGSGHERGVCRFNINYTVLFHFNGGGRNIKMRNVLYTCIYRL